MLRRFRDRREYEGMYLPVYDPEWLQASLRRCLWDGRRQRRNDHFCSEACSEHYAEWRDRIARLPIGRQPAIIEAEELESDETRAP